MSKLIALAGDTGTGKSHSIQFLNPEETYVINVAGKDLPFKGSSSMYNRDKKNYMDVENAPEIQRLLQTISEKATHIKNIIIEDGNYIMGFNLIEKATQVGYTKFSVMARDMVNLIQSSKKLRDDLTVVYISHTREVYDGDAIVSYQMKTAGKMIDSQIKMEGLFTVTLYAIAEEKGDEVNYHFLTNRYDKYPAKSPQGMFDEVIIPNNLKTVIDKVNEYYK